MNWKLIKKLAAAIAAASFLFVGTVGFLHTPAGRNLPIGRKLLTWLGMHCPIDFSKLTPERVEASRQRGVQSLAGNRPAPTRAALAGLRFGETTEAGAADWAKTRGLPCASHVRGMRFLKCEQVTPAALPAEYGTSPIQMLTLAFGPTGKLVAIDVFRTKLSASEAALIGDRLHRKLDGELGHPSVQAGQFESGYLGGGPMRTAVVSYSFSNYVVSVSATNIPWSGGVAVHEQYSAVGSSAQAS